jgi:hypothetical protein
MASTSLSVMSPEREDDEPTQTTPAGVERDELGLPGEGGAEIPVPRRDDVFDAFVRVARGSRRDDDSPESD